jgi:hypothetical protein
MTETTSRREPQPFHGTSAPTPNAPRLLLVSYHFPPAETVGARRWAKIAPWIAAQGWELDVITAQPPTSGALARSRLGSLPPGTRVYGVDAPASWIERLHSAFVACARFITLRRLRGGRHRAPPRSDTSTTDQKAGTRSSLAPAEIRFDLRDLGAVRRAYTVWILHTRDHSWARAAAKTGEALIDGSQYLAVITSGPPHLTHEAGRLLAARHRLPFIMDFRDPWSIERRLPENYASPLFFTLARRYERRAVARADLVVTNTHELSSAMQMRYRETRVLTVMNGFDDEPIPPSNPDSCFIIAYTGGIYVDRDPRPLFRAVRLLLDHLDLTPSELRIELVGRVDRYDGRPIHTIVQEEGIDAYVRASHWRPRREVLELLARSSVAVCLPQDNPYAIPSKVFEYMRFRVCVLALTEQDSPLHRLLRGTEADVASPGDVRAISEILVRRYNEFRAGRRPQPLATDRRFSQEAQVEPLLSAIAAGVRWAAPDASRPDVQPKATPLERMASADR